MPKGHNNGRSNAYATATTYFLAYLRERIQNEFDRFRSTVPIAEVELTSGLAELFSTTGQWTANQMSMRVQTGRGRTGAQTLEGAIKSYGSGSQHSTNEGIGKADKHERKISAAGRAAIVAAQKKRWAKTAKVAANGPKTYFDKLTPRQRKAAMIAKLSKRKDPMAKKILAGLLGKSKTNPKQKIYIERAKAKKQGKPLPPLPSEKNAA